MIRAEVIKQENGVTKVIFTSNDLKNDQDSLDLIGEAIVGDYPRRGGYRMTDGAMEIDVKTGDL